MQDREGDEIRRWAEFEEILSMRSLPQGNGLVFVVWAEYSQTELCPLLGVPSESKCYVIPT